MNIRSTQTMTIHPGKHMLPIFILHIISALAALLFINASVFVILHIPNYIKNRDALITMDIVSAIVGNILVIYSSSNQYMLWQTWRKKQPLLRIDTEGLTLTPGKEAHPLLIPWEEIKWIGHNSQGTLTIRLRHPFRWWITYGHGRLFYSWPGLLTTGYLSFAQSYLDTPINDILFAIGQHYRDTLSSLDIRIKYPRSRPFFRRPTQPHTSE